MKVALVHDYLREYGGAERVLETIHEIWPDAPLYTSFVDFESLGRHADRFRSWDIRSSWVQNNFFVKKFHSPLRFLAPWVWNSFDLSKYDVVISSSGWYMCRGVKTKVQSLKSKDKKQEGALHICYIHHPPRNLYGYATGSTIQKYWPVRVYAAIINFFLRHYDYETAQNVDYFVANSEETARRVQKFYRRDSTVIYPPVDVSSITYPILSIKQKQNKEYYISVGRLTYSKRLDIVIKACNQLKLPLKIVGVGNEEEKLKAIAGSTIEFLGSKSDQEVTELYANAKALLFAALDEDFGMVPIEAMAHGVPVIALSQGGVKETVVDGKTGVWFMEPTVALLIVAIERFEKEEKEWGPDCIQQANKFSKERFVKELKKFVDKKSSE